jgi:flagellar motor component MotA
VSIAAKDGRVVLAGRSLREVERHIDDLGRIAFVAWVATLLGAFVAVVLVELVGGRLGGAA